MFSIEENIFRYAEKNPDKYALISNRCKLSYFELTEQINYLVGFFSEKYNIKTGDKVVLEANKGHEFITAYFALHLIGAVAIILDYETSENRLNYILNTTNPILIIGKFRHLTAVSSENIYENIFNRISLKKNPIQFNYPNFDIDNDSDILFTSGTTGSPKGIVLTNKNLAVAANNINSFIGTQESDIELLALPLSHSFGLGRMRSMLSIGASIVLINGFTNVKKYFESILINSVTVLAFVPSAWNYLKKMSGNKLGEFKDQIRFIEIGSAPMSEPEKRIISNLLPKTKICMHYGLTEASRSTFLDFSEKSKLNTIGKATPNVDILIVDSEGKKVSIDEEGEIVIKGEHTSNRYVFGQYYDERNKENSYHDYIRTGDIGTMDNEGYIMLKGRIEEHINVGGKKVYPIEIETIINSIDHIQESACVGYPDEKGVLGEVIKAYIVGNKTIVDIQTLKSIVQSQLEPFKWPYSYEWINEIPKTESGKIQRYKLK